MSALSDADLAAIRERAEAATVGPWEATRARGGSRLLSCVIAPDDPTGDDRASAVTLDVLPADAEFIAHARTDVPRLLAEVERLTAEVAERRSVIAMSDRARVHTIDILLDGLGITDHRDDRTEAEVAALLDGCDCNGEQGTDHLVWHLAQKLAAERAAHAALRVLVEALGTCRRGINGHAALGPGREGGRPVSAGLHAALTALAEEYEADAASEGYGGELWSTTGTRLRNLLDAHAQAAPASETDPTADGPCRQCSRRYRAWFAPHHIWNIVMGGPDAADDPGGMLCPTCFLDAAKDSPHLATRGAWELAPFEYPAPAVADQGAKLTEEEQEEVARDVRGLILTTLMASGFAPDAARIRAILWPAIAKFVIERILAAHLAARDSGSGQGATPWSAEDRRDVSAWLLREADQRVEFFPQRRDGVDALIRHLSDHLAARQPEGGEQG